MTKYLIIGAGKLAKHIQHYLSLCEIPANSWDRSQDPHLLKTKVQESTHVLLAISDSALTAFYQRHLAGLSPKVIHFSGALNIDGTIAAHPLMSFGPELYDLATYQKIHFVLTGASDLNEALPGLPNSFSCLPAAQKPLYHALCVMGGNFPVILWQKMLSEFQKLGISHEQAAIYLQAVLQNTLTNPQTALTGPLARKDGVTVEKNLRALEHDPFQNIYHAFVQTMAPELLSQKERTL